MTEYRINESADKITLKAEVKRGSGTRDQDKIKIKVKSDDPSKAVHKLNECIDQITDSAATLRGIQNDGNS